MKKLILGVFLVASALSFSAERKVQVEQVFKNANTDIVYVQGEETPYTGIIEIKFPNGKTQALMAYKNGVMHGKGITYYPSGKVWSKGNYKNGVEDGINIIYYGQFLAVKSWLFPLGEASLLSLDSLELVYS